MKYTVKKGDSLIKIARAFNLNSIDDIVKANNIKDPNLIQVGQELELPEAEFFESLPAAVATATTQDYSRTPASQLPNTRDVDAGGNMIPGYADRVNAYAQAIRDGKMTLNQIPEQYRQQAYNQSIRNATNAAAPYVMKWVLGAPWSIPDAVVRGGLNEGRKLIARASGTASDVVDNDYGISDYFGNFSWTGKKFQQEHPGWALAADVVATPAVMVGAENVAARAMDGALENTGARLMQNARGTAKAMGVAEQEAPRAAETVLPGRGAGVKFTSGAKGSGKTGTATRGTRGGYNANNSGKGTFGHQASYTPKGTLQHKTPTEVAIPDNFVGTGYWHGLYMPLPEPRRTNYVIVEPEEKHIEETVPQANRWIWGPKTEKQVPYKEGDERLTYITAQAPSGNSVREQPITKESIQKNEGSAKREAKEVKGPVRGSTPSGYYSGYGFTYGTEGGPWLRKQGGKLIPRNNFK